MDTIGVVDISNSVGQYVALRDKIKEIETTQQEYLKPYRDALEVIGNKMLKHLQDTNTDAAKTSNGTAYISERASVTLTDPKIFMDFVIANSAFELMDRKANAPAVSEFIKAHDTLPPGVKFSKTIRIGVRRSGDKVED